MSRDPDMALAIQRVDVEWDEEAGVDWTPLIEPKRRAVRSLLNAFKAEAESTVGVATLRALLGGIRGLNRVWGGPFRAEVDAIAEAGGVDPALVLGANLAYDAGHAACTTASVPTGRGPLHFRNMDWFFPRGLLRRHSAIVHVHGAPAGDYLTLTWPGFFGALTAVAPGRFAVTVNFVHHPEESTRAGLAWRGVRGFWPVPWAVRNVLDGARTFGEAVTELSTNLLVSPVLLMVTGTRDGEAVVIERGVNSYATRRARSGAPLLLTNHYLAPGAVDENVEDVEEIMWSGSRLERLGTLLDSATPRTAAEAFAVLDAEGIRMDETQQQVVLSAAEGSMTLRVPGHGELVVNV